MESQFLYICFPPEEFNHTAYPCLIWFPRTHGDRPNEVATAMTGDAERTIAPAEDTATARWIEDAMGIFHIGRLGQPGPGLGSILPSVFQHTPGPPRAEQEWRAGPHVC